MNSSFDTLFMITDKLIFPRNIIINTFSQPLLKANGRY